MRMLNLNLEDGKGLVSVAVADDVEVDRIQRFMRDSVAAISITSNPPVVDYHDVARFLTSLGWQARCDAQWHGLRDALPELFEMLSAR
jgi:hypothetical protein